MGLAPRALAALLDGGDTVSLMRLFRYLPDAHEDCAQGTARRQGRGSPGGRAAEPGAGEGEGEGEAAAAPVVERTGSSPHTDWGFLTLILGDGSGGLQVQGGE